jgi:hypothetical protein
MHSKPALRDHTRLTRRYSLSDGTCTGVGVAAPTRGGILQSSLQTELPGQHCCERMAVDNGVPSNSAHGSPMRQTMSFCSTATDTKCALNCCVERAATQYSRHVHDTEHTNTQNGLMKEDKGAPGAPYCSLFSQNIEYCSLAKMEYTFINFSLGV